MDVTGRGATEFDMHTFYREPRQGGKARGCKSGRKLRAFCRDLQIGADFGSYIVDVVDKCVAAAPMSAFGKLEAAIDARPDHLIQLEKFILVPPIVYLRPPNQGVLRAYSSVAKKNIQS
jgi:hypothetical protein